MLAAAAVAIVGSSCHAARVEMGTMYQTVRRIFEIKRRTGASKDDSPPRDNDGVEHDEVLAGGAGDSVPPAKSPARTNSN